MKNPQVVCPISFSSGKEQSSSQVPLDLQRRSMYQMPVTQQAPLPYQTVSVPQVQMLQFVPYGYHTLSEKRMEEVAAHIIKKQIDSDYNNAQGCRQQERAKELIDYREERKVKREMAVYSIFEDPEGCIRYVKTMPDGQEFFSKPIISEKKLKLTRFKAENEDNYLYALSWEGCKHKEILKRWTAQDFEQVFNRAGINIYLSKSKRKELIDIIRAYLLNKSSTIIIPKTEGWYFSDGEWKFATDDKQTFNKLEGDS